MVVIRMSSVTQNLDFWILLGVVGLYLKMFYSWLWAKLKVMEKKRAEKKAKEAEERKKKQGSTNISTDDATRLMALLKKMTENKAEEDSSEK
jgi:hypothetical protein